MFKLFENFLNVDDFKKNDDDKSKDKVFKKQENNKKLSDLFTNHVELNKLIKLMDEFSEN